MIDRLPGPELSHQLDRLLELGDAVLSADPCRPDLVGVVPYPDAHIQAALGDVVDGGQVVGQIHRVEDRELEYLGGKAQVPRHRRQARHHHQRLHPVRLRALVVVGEGGVTEATALQHLHQPLDVGDPEGEGVVGGGRREYDLAEGGADFNDPRPPIKSTFTYQAEGVQR